MKQKEAWWVCNKCEIPIAKTKDEAYLIMLEHRKFCGPEAGYYIKQIIQDKINKKNIK